MKYPQVQVLCTTQSLWLQISSEPSCWDPINAESADWQGISCTMRKIGKVFEVRSIVTTLLQRAFCSQHRAGLQVHCERRFYQNLAGDVTWWIMPLSSEAVFCLDFCLGPKLPEFNLLSRVFLKSAQIIHPWNITPLLSHVEKSTSHHTAAYSSMGRVAWGSV